MKDIVKMAHGILAMSDRIIELEGEVEHYKELYELYKGRSDSAGKAVEQNIGTMLQAALNPNSVINVGLAEIERRRATGELL
jgi:hypothetical protein